MVARQTVCLKRLGRHRKGEERVGRFFANPKVTAEKIIESWSQQTGSACSGRQVLLIEDHCEVKVPTTAQRRRGLGPVKKSLPLRRRGIAVDATSGACLGSGGG